MGKNFNSAFNVPAARPRTPVTEEQVLNFVKGSGAEHSEALSAQETGASNTQEPSFLGTQEPSSSRSQVPEKRLKTKLSKKKTILRVSGRELRRVGIYFPADLARDLAVHCAGEGIELSAFVVTSVRRELARK